MSDSKQTDSDTAMARLLAEALRQPAGAATDSACPDAELLAAYAEHNLDASETAQCEKHFAECARCQKILAVLTVSAEEPLSETELERFGRKVAAAELGVPVAGGRKPIKPVKKVVSFQRPQTAWAWLASGVGIAAAAALWIALRPPTQPPSVATTAQNAATESAAPPSESLEARANVPEPPAAAEREAEQQQLKSLESTPARKKEIAPPTQAGQSRRDQEPAPPLAEAAPKSQTNPASQSQQVLQAANEPAQGLSTAKQSEKATAAAAPPPPPVAPRPAAAEPASSFAAPPPPASTDATERSVAPFPATAANPAQASAGATATAENKAAPNRTVQPFAARQAIGGLVGAPGRNVTLASPSGNVQWRVGPRGEIQRSTDRGQTWQQQASGITSVLVGGAATADNVAWIVGRAGVILRTTDGEHWQRIGAPDSTADWNSVQATDAEHATITASDQRRFATEDGGQTWKQQ